MAPVIFIDSNSTFSKHNHALEILGQSVYQQRRATLFDIVRPKRPKKRLENDLDFQ